MPRTTLLAVLVLVVVVSIAFAVKPAAAPPPNLLRIGMPVSSAKQICSRVKIQQTGPKSFSRPDPDTDWLFYRIAFNIDLVLTYSKSAQKITKISLFYCTTPRRKANEVFTPARSIRFDADGSYVVHFEPPMKIEPGAKKGQYPSLPPSDWLPANQKKQ